MKKRQARYERRVPLLALLSALPALVVALLLLWTGDFSSRVQWTVTLAVAGGWFGFWLALRERLIRPLQRERYR